MCMCMRGDLGGCGCPWDMECEFPGESKRAKKRKEWAEVDERGVCENGEWGGVTQAAFSPGGPGMPQRLPVPQLLSLWAADSFLTPLPGGIDGTCSGFAQGLGWPILQSKTPNDCDWETEASGVGWG